MMTRSEFDRSLKNEEESSNGEYLLLWVKMFTLAQLVIGYNIPESGERYEWAVVFVIIFALAALLHILYWIYLFFKKRLK